MNESQRDAIKEGIKFDTDLIRLLTIAIIVTAGGVSALIIKEPSSLVMKILVGGGGLILVIFVALLISLVVRNLRKLKELKDV